MGKRSLSDLDLDLCFADGTFFFWNLKHHEPENINGS